MQKTFNFFYVFLLAILGVGVTLMAEEITLTTYYPAPYGAYEELSTTGNTYLATSSGNVGIGTTAPALWVKLDVRGDKSIFGSTTSIQNEVYIRGGTVEGGELILQAANNGNPGYAADSWIIDNYSPGNLFRICHGPIFGEVIVATPGGSVGIGTTNPGYTLEVAGTIRSTGKGTFSGGIDPPYISFTEESHESIREYAKDIEEHEKIMQFWNGEAHRLEIYVIAEDRFYTITGEPTEE